MSSSLGSVSSVVVLVAVFTLASATACSRGEQSSTPESKLVADLYLFGRGKPLGNSDAASKGKALAAGKLTLEGVVDDVLSKPMGGRLAKDLAISPTDNIKDRHPVASHSTLKSTKTEPRIYYLRAPCSATEAEKVKAWWGDDVLVCVDAHRPTVMGDGHGRTCGATMLAPRDTDTCGCGPRLVFCARDEKMYDEMQQDFQEELVLTAGYVVDNDLPIESLFTMNETVRNRDAELLYRRARIIAGEDAATLLPIDDIGEEAALHPRKEMVPGHHAGVLTTPSLTYGSDALRGVLRNAYDYLWCTGQSSSRVTTAGVMNLGVVDLRTGDGWKQLAAMPICTDCHARLDYGMQFFHGFPSSTSGIDFRPVDHIGSKGPLYVNDIKDDRGSDDLTPAGFARLAVAQPEFGKCMTKKIVDHVFNGRETADDFKAVHETFKGTHRLKAMLKTAMLRYGARAQKGPLGPAAAPATTSSSSTSMDPHAAAVEPVKLSKALRTMLDDSCLSCHDKGDPYDFTGDTLPRATLAVMIDQVGFRGMPKTAAGLDDDARLAFVAEAARHVFDDDKERSTAFEYFGHGMRGFAAHRYRSAIANVNDQASQSAKDAFKMTTVENSVSQSLLQYSPSLAVAVGVSAIKACGKNEACIRKVTAPTNVIAGATSPR